MESAPRDGTRILVAVRSSEQGPAEVDVVRWGRARGAEESCWMSVDSEPDCAIIYAESELSAWQPLPRILPPLRRADAGRPINESDGSGI